MVHFSLSLC